jgi:PEP-CTERM motif-containing protein
MRYQVFNRQRAFRRTLVCLALAAAYSSAWALPAFTLNPSAAGMNGSSFTADNILISDFSSVNFTDATHFTDTGLLQVTSFQLGNSTFTPPGLNSSGGYSLWFEFTGTGHLTSGTAATLASAPSNGEFDSLTYTFNGAAGTSTFDVVGSTPTRTGPAPILLASGALIEGGVGSTSAGGGHFVPTAAATVSFATAAGASGFFESPSPFYNVALSAFTNTLSEVSFNGTGFTIRQGGGSVNFASPVPEPDTYALMLGGLGVLGFLARRRRS